MSPVSGRKAGGRTSAGPEPLYTDPRYGGGIADGEIRPFAPVRIPSDAMWMAFGATLPIGQHYANPEGTNPPFVSFCDFASAGNEWNRSQSYRTWLPIERSHAEQPFHHAEFAEDAERCISSQGRNEP